MSSLTFQLLFNILNCIPSNFFNNSLFLFEISVKSSGFTNLSQSCVPIGSHFKTYSAPIIAKIYYFNVLFNVATNIIPFFFNNLELSLIKKSISLTCSTISIFKITSNLVLFFNISGDATL